MEVLSVSYHQSEASLPERVREYVINMAGYIYDHQKYLITVS